MSKAHRINPTSKLFYTEGGTNNAEDVFESCSVRYPFVETTYRVTEHWQTGLMTRNTPWLLEAVPQNILELSRELAPGKYRIRIDALGQVLEEPLTIVPDQTTMLGLGVEGDRFVIRR